MCRVFKKSPNGKKPLLNTSAVPSPLSSQCNAASVTELGELDVSILNNMVSPSVSLNSMQTNETSSNNSRIDMNLYNMNWMMTRETTSQPILSWPASLSGTSLISGSPNVQKELPYNGYQAADHDRSSLDSLMRQGDYSFHASSSEAMDTVQQLQQHEHESIWQGY